MMLVVTNFSYKLMPIFSTNQITPTLSLFQLQSNPLYDVRSRWHNIVIPDLNVREDSKSVDLLRPFTKDHQHSTLKQGGSYIFFALEPNTKYEVRIQAQNTHGWGRFSEEFLFSTRSTGIGIIFYVKRKTHMNSFEGDVPKELPVEVHSNGMPGWCLFRIQQIFRIQRLETNTNLDITLM